MGILPWGCAGFHFYLGKLREVPGRIVAHLDMDAFYAAIEERDNPRFAGKPVVVGADPKGGKGRGVVSTANYEARKFGVKSAMPISRAHRLAPTAIFLPPDIPKYRRVSEKIFRILKSEIPVVEQAGTDEFYLDISYLGSYEKAIDTAIELKRKIRENEKLTVSVGIGPNKLVAKIASDKNKPDGLTVVKPADVNDFLAPLDIRKIPGIGPKTAQIFYAKRIKTIGDLWKLSKEELKKLLGSFGETLFDLTRGKDERPVGEVRPVKSIGKQVTFEEDTSDPKFITNALLALARDVWEELKARGLSAKTVTVTARYENFETHTKSETPRGGLGKFDQLKKIVLKLLLPFLDRKRKVRLVGVRLSNPSRIPS